MCEAVQTARYDDAPVYMLPELLLFVAQKSLNNARKICILRSLTHRIVSLFPHFLPYFPNSRKSEHKTNCYEKEEKEKELHFKHNS